MAQDQSGRGRVVHRFLLLPANMVIVPKLAVVEQGGILATVSDRVN